MLRIMVLPWSLSAPALQPLTPANLGDPAVAELPLPPLQDPHRFRVMSWNIAHGRGAGWHQVFTSRMALDRHLAGIAELIREATCDVVALQEADHGSWWNSRVDMPRDLAGRCGLGWIAQASQVRAWGLDYGTAVLSRHPQEEAIGHAFPASALAPGKGCTVTTCLLPDGRRCQVISVHLHFLGGPRQRREAQQLVALLSTLPGPIVLCGDFNASWRQGRGLVAQLARTLDLQAWQPSLAMPTLIGSRRRIDWILVSRPLQINDCRVIPSSLSDHHALVADLTWPVAPAAVGGAGG